jgi:hypothetical protein
MNSHVAYLRPKKSAPSDVKDHFEVPVNSDSKKGAHGKFAKIFGSSMAKHYEVVHVKLFVKPTVAEEVEQVDEARRMSAAEKLGRAFDSEQQRSALSRQRGNELLKSREKENDAVKAQTKKLKGMHEEVKDMSYGKKLAKAIMAKQSKHPIAQQMGEAVKDQADVGEYDYEGDMAKSQLRSILANAQRLHDMLEDQTNLPEWVQSKITLAEDYILTAANYMEGEMNEEVEQVDELKKSTLASYVGKAVGRLAAASRLQKDFEKDGHTALAGEFEKSAQKKKVGIQKAANKLAKEEAEGKVAVTPKEKALAAHHGDPKKITYGDVIKARLKSAAAKKMGK